MEAISEHNTKIRSLNLSHNQLYFDNGQEGAESDYSDIFLDRFLRFVQISENLAHLDLSGMGYRPKQLIKLSLVLVEAPSLVAIHLNDNGLYGRGLFESADQARPAGEILDIFGAESVHERTGEEKDPRDFANNCPVRAPDLLKEMVDKYTRNLQKQEVVKGPKGYTINSHEYQSFLMKRKQGQAVSQSKQINSCQAATGSGRYGLHNSIDEFTLTRKVNHPELIFNQDPYKDSYFEIDCLNHWRLAD
jgi:hypothetical protein